MVIDPNKFGPPENPPVNPGGTPDDSQGKIASGQQDLHERLDDLIPLKEEGFNIPDDIPLKSEKLVLSDEVPAGIFDDRESLHPENHSKEDVSPVWSENVEDPEHADVAKDDAVPGASKHEHTSHVVPDAVAQAVPKAEYPEVFTKKQLGKKAAFGMGAGAVASGVGYYFSAEALKAAVRAGGTWSAAATPWLGVAIAAFWEAARTWGISRSKKKDIERDFTAALLNYLREGNYIDDAIEHATRRLKNCMDLDDRALVDPEGKRMLEIFEETGAISALETPILGNEMNYAKYCFIRFKRKCDEAATSALPEGIRVSEGEWHTLGQLGRLENRDRLLGLSEAYGRSIADLHRKFSDCYTVPGVAISGIAAGLLTGVTGALPGLLYGPARWLWRRYKDRKSDVFEIGPDGKMRDPKSVIEVTKDAFLIAQRAGGEVKDLRKRMVLRSQAAAHGHVTQEDVDDVKKEYDDASDELQTLRWDSQMLTDPLEKRTKNAEIIEKNKEVRVLKRKLEEKEKSLKKEKDEHEKMSKTIFARLKKSILDPFKEYGTKFGVSTGSAVLGYPLGYVAGYLVSYIVPTAFSIPTSTIGSMLGVVGGAVGGWILGKSVYANIKSGSKTDGHH